MFHDQSDTFAKSLDRTMTPEDVIRESLNGMVKANRGRQIALVRSFDDDPHLIQVGRKNPLPSRPTPAPETLLPPIEPSPPEQRTDAPHHETAILTMKEFERATLTVREIVAIVAAAHEMPIDRLMAKCREADVTNARKHLVHVIFRERPKMGSTEIGRRIGGFDHSTVLYARDTFKDVAPLLQEQIRKVDEALAKMRQEAV